MTVMDKVELIKTSLHANQTAPGNLDQVGSSEGAVTSKSLDKILQFPDIPNSQVFTDRDLGTSQVEELKQRMQTALASIENSVKNVNDFFKDVLLKNEHYLKPFFKYFPFVADLHSHLDGAIPSRLLLNAAVSKNLFCKMQEDGSFIFYEQTDTKHASTEGISAKVLQESRKYEGLRQKFYNVINMSGAKDNKTTGKHKHFFRAFKTLESIASHLSLKEKLELFLRDTDKNSVKYIESSIWFEREELPEGFEEEFNQVFSGSFNEESIKLLIKKLEPWTQRYVLKAQEMLDDCKIVDDQILLEKGYDKDDFFSINNPTVIRFIIDNDRTIPSLAMVFASFVASMTLEESDYRVVGSGFAGEEFYDVALNDYDNHMKIISSLKKCFPNSKLSLHAGELNKVLAQTDEALESHVRKAVDAGANRIGHAVCITEDPNWDRLLEQMVLQDIHVEICIRSNEFVLGIINGKHPLLCFIQYGVPFSFCTDDQGVNNSSLWREMFLAAQRYNPSKEHEIAEEKRLDYIQLKRAAVNSIRNSFLPGESIYSGVEQNLTDLFRGEDAFGNIRCIIRSCIKDGKWEIDPITLLTKSQRLSIEKSEKAQLEFKLEKEFAFFEEFIVPEMQKKFNKGS